MKIVKKILKIIFWIILIVIAIYSMTIIAQKILWKDRTPNFFGYKNMIVLSGSMEPTLNVGDIVIVKETNDIKEQDIISFKVQNSIVTHRVVEIKKENEKNFYITKGDANSAVDLELIELKDIEGKYIFKIPLLGNIIMLLQKPIAVGILILILIVSLILSFKPKKEN